MSATKPWAASLWALGLPTLLTHDCTTPYSTNHPKFAGDTTLVVVSLITLGDETHYRKVVDLLTMWCSDNYLLLNVSKTKDIVVHFKRSHTKHPPLTIDGATLQRATSAKFLGVHISEDLSWTTKMALLVKIAQQHLYFLHKLKRASASPPFMTTFYTGTVESILKNLTIKLTLTSLHTGLSLQIIISNRAF